MRIPFSRQQRDRQAQTAPLFNPCTDKRLRQREAEEKGGLQFQATSSVVLLLTILSARPLTDVQDSDTGQEVREGGRAGVYIRRRAVMWRGQDSVQSTQLHSSLAAGNCSSFFSGEREGSLSPSVSFYLHWLGFSPLSFDL